MASKIKLNLLGSLLLMSGFQTPEKPKPFYKISRISQSLVGISCPGNNGDPTVVTNVAGTLLVSCGK